MIDVHAAGMFASKHDLARQLAAAVMRRGTCLSSRIVTMRKGD
jgi:hypothetical protein